MTCVSVNTLLSELQMFCYNTRLLQMTTERLIGNEVSKLDIAVRNRNHHTATRNRMPCGITHPAEVTLPLLSQPKLVLDLATLE